MDRDMLGNAKFEYTKLDTVNWEVGKPENWETEIVEAVNMG